MRSRMSSAMLKSLLVKYNFECYTSVDVASELFEAVACMQYSVTSKQYSPSICVQNNVSHPCLPHLVAPGVLGNNSRNRVLNIVLIKA